MDTDGKGCNKEDSRDSSQFRILAATLVLVWSFAKRKKVKKKWLPALVDAGKNGLKAKQKIYKYGCQKQQKKSMQHRCKNRNNYLLVRWLAGIDAGISNHILILMYDQQRLIGLGKVSIKKMAKSELAGHLKKSPPFFKN